MANVPPSGSSDRLSNHSGRLSGFSKVFYYKELVTSPLRHLLLPKKGPSPQRTSNNNAGLIPSPLDLATSARN